MGECPAPCLRSRQCPNPAGPATDDELRFDRSSVCAAQHGQLVPSCARSAATSFVRDETPTFWNMLRR
jgi:hypothetical protein